MTGDSAVQSSGVDQTVTLSGHTNNTAEDPTVEKKSSIDEYDKREAAKLVAEQDWAGAQELVDDILKSLRHDSSGAENAEIRMWEAHLADLILRQNIKEPLEEASKKKFEEAMDIVHYHDEGSPDAMSIRARAKFQLGDLETAEICCRILLNLTRNGRDANTMDHQLRGLDLKAKISDQQGKKVIAETKRKQIKEQQKDELWRYPSWARDQVTKIQREKEQKQKEVPEQNSNRGGSEGIKEEDEATRKQIEENELEERQKVLPMLEKIGYILLQDGRAVEKAGDPKPVSRLDAWETAVNEGNDLLAIYLMKGINNKLVRDNNGQTLLHYAARLNKPQFIKLAVDNGADLEEEDSLGKTPLYLTTIYNSNDKLEALEMLLRLGAKANIIPILDPTSALCQATWSGKYNMMKLLLDNGADVNLQKIGYSAPIHSAVNKFDGVESWKKLECLKLLLNQEGINVNSAGPDGMTALHLAVQERLYGFIKALIDHGADPCAQHWGGVRANVMVNKAKINSLFWPMLKLS